MNSADALIAELKAAATEKGKKSSAHFGVSIETLGVRMPVIRDLAKSAGKNHELALALWASGIHEARILATLVAEKKQVTPDLADAWTAEFQSWDLCDQACINLYVKLPFADEKIVQWEKSDTEYIKRAAFALIATSAVHRKKEPDELFLAFLPLIKRAADDNRNFVKKAVNWALRQIGKRNKTLNAAALACAEEIAQMAAPSAKWIAADAIAELTSEKIKNRLKG